MLKPFTPKPRYIPKVRKHEESLQKRVCSYLRKEYPQAIFRSDYAAGLQLTENQARIMHQINSCRGYPDLFIATPSRGYHGLYLELKREGTTIYVTRGPQKGQMSVDLHIREQAAVIQQLNGLGYFARFAVGYEKACKIIDWYFERPQNGELF